ncbi:MAG: hypothetical protein KZQ92_15790 [Candidatus Thiodiazotropha sp. (ex Lucinoma borealis)]|nr:hypothetical protein [Candidatus Thiodiazotropha sp. (ex Lucinoma borealis)]MCU7865427.1 hypothetical protein [Candidatus Thiodiazotropha sp. (ex Lucinoma borealis)]
MKLRFITLFLCLLNVAAVSSAQESPDTKMHVFVTDRNQQYTLGGKTQAAAKYRLIWHYWGDVDLIEDAMGKGLPSNQDQALKEMARRVQVMTEHDKTALSAAWRSRIMADDLGVSPDNMPAVWARGHVFKNIEDLRHVFAQLQ